MDVNSECEGAAAPLLCCAFMNFNTVYVSVADRRNGVYTICLKKILSFLIGLYYHLLES